MSKQERIENQPKILINGRYHSPDDIYIKPMSYNLWLQAKIKQIYESTGIIESVFKKHIKKDENKKNNENK